MIFNLTLAKPCYWLVAKVEGVQLAEKTSAFL